VCARETQLGFKLDIPEDQQKFVRSLLACLGRATADDRVQWIRVGTLLKKLSPAFFGDFVEFSRLGEKFQGEDDCRKTWDSLSTESCFGRHGVGLGTLRFLAHRDNPSEYARLTTAFERDNGLKTLA
jgi:hypothetical protein